MVRHLLDSSAGCSCVFMPRSPDQELKKHRREVNAFFRQPVIDLPPVALLRLRGNDPIRLELVQTIGENIRGNSLARPLKLLKGPVSAYHQVADDQ